MPPIRNRMPPLGEYLKQANNNQEDIEYKRALVSTPAGSAKAVALLGPLSLQSVNSDANASLPSGIIAARTAYPHAYFKAGHMINACFGGNGNKSNNLTILTGSANTAMTAYDNRVKDAVEALYNLYAAFHKAKINVFDIGTCRIKLKVEVSDDKWGDNPPESYIADEVTITATFENIPTDRSAFIRDILRPKSDHVRNIKTLQTKVGTYVAQGCGDVDNTL
jgi:hypothetical protein